MTRLEVIAKRRGVTVEALLVRMCDLADRIDNQSSKPKQVEIVAVREAK